MRHTLEFDSENNWALATYHGSVRTEEILELLNQALGWHGWTTKWDRIIDYDDGMLGDLDSVAMRDTQVEMGKMLRRAYGDRPTYSAQVCSDPMKRPLIDYWMCMGAHEYPAGLKLFSTVAEAKAWILTMRDAG